MSSVDYQEELLRVNRLLSEVQNRLFVSEARLHEQRVKFTTHNKALGEVVGRMNLMNEEVGKLRLRLGHMNESVSNAHERGEALAQLVADSVRVAYGQSKPWKDRAREALGAWHKGPRPT